MKLFVATERRFYLDQHGRPCCSDGSRAYSFWTRYLTVFEKVIVVARQSTSRLSDAPPVEGPGVEVCPLTDYRGALQYLAKSSIIRRQIAAARRRADAYLLRIPGQVATLLVDGLRRRRTPFGAEVVGDPYGVFALGASRHPLRSLLRRHETTKLQRICGAAATVAYVTGATLQQRYPAATGAQTTHYSSVELPERAFVDGPRTPSRCAAPRRLVAVGTLDQPYKGLDRLIDAVAHCRAGKLPLELAIIGDGVLRDQLEQHAAHRGVGHCIRFLGRLPAGQAVREQLDRADLFVMPSLTEGLPRAMVEAMARGLPCIGSRVGGIPELLGPAELIPPGNGDALAGKIVELASDPQRCVALSAENLAHARDYHADVLTKRRNAFYRHLRDLTERHLAAHRRAA